MSCFNLTDAFNKYKLQCSATKIPHVCCQPNVHQAISSLLTDAFACRLEGLLYATGVAYSESAGVLLDSNVLDLALAFTDSVPLLNASMFTVTGPANMSTTELQTVDSSDAYYTFSVTVPDNYYGSITVAMDKVCSLTEAPSLASILSPAAVAHVALYHSVYLHILCMLCIPSSSNVHCDGSSLTIASTV